MNEPSTTVRRVPLLSGELPPPCKRDLELLKSFVRDHLRHHDSAEAVSPSAFKELFLTGATGFFGKFFLRTLLDLDDSLVIHCLIRADNVDEGAKRLQTALTKANLWKDDDRHRIRVIIGDITKDQFGLADEVFADLCQRIDGIYHLAADLSLAAPYLKLRRSNTFGIRNIIELSLTTRFKHIFYASTLGVFPEYFCLFGREFETSHIKDESQPDIDLMKRHFPLGMIGYPWSKLVSEQALLFAHTAGMPLAIFRLPITGFATSGYTNFTNIITKMSAATTQTEMSPPGYLARNFGEPVDILADICVSISMNPDRRHLIYHCSDFEPVDYEIRPEDLGIYLEAVSYQEFKRACLKHGKSSPLDGQWLLIDHFSKYWYYDREQRHSSQIDDSAMRNDCPFPIKWPSALTNVVRAWEWIDNPENEWPYSQPNVQFEFNRLIERAESYAESRNVQFEDTYPSWMRQGLHHYIESLNSRDVKLRNSRRSVTILQINNMLRENAQLARERNLHPEIEHEVIEKPVFILGINRTGTTFLHRLMSRDPRFWTLKLYELMQSVLPNADYASVAGTADDSRRNFALDYLNSTDVSETFAGIHHFDADEAEEEIKLLNLSFASWTTAIIRNSPPYFDWLEKTGAKYAYRYHRRVLQHFNWQRRLIDSTQFSKQWVLKMPFHLMELEKVADTYPDACFIQTHRKPHEFMGSWLSLVEKIRLQILEPQSRHDLGIEQLNLMSKMMNRAIDFRTCHPELENRWIDINFADFVQNPMKIVSDIYEKFDWPLEPSALDKMENWRKQQDEQRKHEVRHRYDLADYGLTPTMVDGAFENYLDFVKKLDFSSGHSNF